MRLATNKIYTIYRMEVHEDHVWGYDYSSADEALKQKKELVEVFEINEKDISISEIKYDDFGNVVSKRKI